MSIRRKHGQAEATRRAQRRARPDRGLSVEQKLDGPRSLNHAKRGTRRTRNHAFGDIPMPKQPGFDAAHNRAFKGLLCKPDARARYDAGEKPSYTWVVKRKRRAAQKAAEGATA